MKYIAKFFRVLTVPPILALILLSYLCFCAQGFFASPFELILVGACIVIIPLLAYPISFFVPALRAGGRRTQRISAFVSTGIGYTILFVLTLICDFSEKLTFVCVTYFFSLLLLILFNKGLGLRASGHACGVIGPLFVFVYAGGPIMLLPCLCVIAVTVWSSIDLGRHTAKELLLGALCSVVAILTSLISVLLFM